MPAMTAHHLFGEAVLEGFGYCDRQSVEYQAFNLGNQGPDPFAYARLPRMDKLSGLLHAKDPSKLIFSWSELVRQAPEGHRSILKAYGAGMICHYAFDCAVHPLVGSYERAIVENGCFGFTEKDSMIAHFVIERELDEMSLFRETGLTVSDCDPVEMSLEIQDDALAAISAALAKGIGAAYGLEVSPDYFQKGVRRFRFLQRAMAHPRGGAYGLLLSIENLLLPRSITRALRLRPVSMELSHYANGGNGSWIDPWSGEERTESFFDLRERALERVASYLPALLEYSPDDDLIAEFTQGRDFSGKLAGKA